MCRSSVCTLPAAEEEVCCLTLKVRFSITTGEESLATVDRLARHRSHKNKNSKLAGASHRRTCIFFYFFQ